MKPENMLVHVYTHMDKSTIQYDAHINVSYTLFTLLPGLYLAGELHVYVAK